MYRKLKIQKKDIAGAAAADALPLQDNILTSSFNLSIFKKQPCEINVG